MRPLRALAAFLILAGAALTVYGIATGEMQVALIVFVPVIVASSALGILAIGSIIGGVFVGIVDLFLGAGTMPQDSPLDEGKNPPGAKTEFGGVVLIGPIPIILGSNKRMAVYAMLVALAVLALIVLALLLGR
ncbi:MAG: DUF131 domain-containing protein [Methanomassiliicoccales archaeon]|nr:DUF131 domain-containing protein [Methanomassiliicoccales archaeon]